MEGHQWKGENGRKDTENNKHKWWVQNRQGEIKNNIGNGEAKELIYMTQRHEPVSYTHLTLPTIRA